MLSPDPTAERPAKVAPTPIDWNAWRRAFPAVEAQILLNAAGGAPLSSVAADAGKAYFHEMAAVGDSLFGDWLARADATRDLAARLIRASAQDIAFLASASVAMNVATGLVPATVPVVSLEDEFPSVTLPWMNRGHPTTLVPLGPNRHADPVSLVAAMDMAMDQGIGATGPVKGVLALSHVQFRNGHRVDLKTLCHAAAERGWLTIVDATQSLGAVPIDVRETPISVLMASGYKWLCAGYGNAVVYVSPAVRNSLPPPVFGWRSAQVPYALHADQLDPGDTAITWEMGHPPFAPVFALKGALEHLATVGVDAVWQRLQGLNQQIHDGLAAAGLPAPLSGAGESGITVLPTAHGAAIKAALAKQGIAVTASAGALRLSPHAYTREEEVSKAMAALANAWVTVR